MKGINNKAKKVIGKLLDLHFVKSISQLLSGTIVAQFIAILASPLIYRIYSKSDFGLFAIFGSLVSIIGPLSTLQYTPSIINEKEEENTIQIVWLLRIINLTVSILVLLILIICKNYILGQLSCEEIGNFIFLLPISIICVGHIEIFRTLANKRGNYKLISINTIILGVLPSLFSICYGYYAPSKIGLLGGFLLSQIVVAFLYNYSYLKSKGLYKNEINYMLIIQMVNKYKSYPIFTMPSIFINQLSNQLPVFMLNSLYGSQIVAVYNLSVRILGLPSQLIANAVGSVFWRDAGLSFHKSGQYWDVFKSTIILLVGMAILPFSILFIFGPDLFAFVFDEKWRDAGVFSQALILLYVAKFIISPISASFFVSSKQKLDLLFQFVFLFISILIFLISSNYKLEAIATLKMLSFFTMVIYLAYLWIAMKFSKSTNFQK